MNWRRGLLLAGIHLAVAWPLIVWQEAREWPHFRPSTAQPQSTAIRLAAWQEEHTATFDPCGFWRSIPPQETVIQMGELPAAALSGWGVECPAPWTFYGILHQGPARDTQRELVTVAAAFGTLIPLQWLLIGGLPLIQPRRWWLEPGAFITNCTLAGAALALIPFVAHASAIPALLTALAWFWWFGLLLWRSLRAAWRLVAHRATARA